MKNDKKELAILGFPINHSFSPTIHTYWMKKYNINGTYKKIKTSTKRLKKIVKNLCSLGYRGVNLTIPLKEETISILNKSDNIVKITKSVNTLIFHNKNLIEGINTDVYGFKKSLYEITKGKNKGKALVIGSGGAARAVVYGLIDMNYKEIVIVYRTKKKARQLKKDMEKQHQKLGKKKIALKNIKNIEDEISNTNLLVNTTPLGMKGFPKMAFSLEKLNKKTSVFDLVYNPLETELIKFAKKNGNKNTNGLKMLLYQAQLSFSFWFNKKPNISKQLEDILRKKIK